MARGVVNVVVLANGMKFCVLNRWVWGLMSNVPFICMEFCGKGDLRQVGVARGVVNVVVLSNGINLHSTRGDLGWVWLGVWLMRLNGSVPFM